MWITLVLSRLSPLATPTLQGFLDRFARAYQDEMLMFLRVARGEAESPCTARDSLEAMRIAVAAGRSRVEHGPVRPMDV